jgi:hypothetical protein
LRIHKNLAHGPEAPQERSAGPIENEAWKTAFENFNGVSLAQNKGLGPPLIPARLNFIARFNRRRVSVPRPALR